MMRKKTFVFFILFYFFFNIEGKSYSTPIITNWVITKVIEKGVYTDPKNFIGKTQGFLGNEVVGPFYRCGFGKGNVANYTTYSDVNEFLSNKEFKVFLKNKLKLNIPNNKKIYVEKYTCADTGAVLYPFIQIEGEKTAYYEFDLGIFELTEK